MAQNTNDGEVVWDGRSSLTDSLERDYADMQGDGWDLIWEPTSDLTTNWRAMEPWARPDPEQFVRTDLERPRRGPRRKAPRILTDWTYERVSIAQQSRGHR